MEVWTRFILNFQVTFLRSTDFIDIFVSVRHEIINLMVVKVLYNEKSSIRSIIAEKLYEYFIDLDYERV